MEEKKKFEKPELNVVQLKQTGMICTSCSGDCYCDGSDCHPETGD